MAKNTISVKTYNNNREEFVANAAITPGHLVEVMSTGKLRVHATQTGNVGPKRFALEDDIQGNGVGDAYSANNKVQTKVFLPGEKVLARLADGTSYAIGDLLESAGDGTLQKFTLDTGSDIGSLYTQNLVGIMREALDLSSSSGADTTYLAVVEII